MVFIEVIEVTISIFDLNDLILTSIYTPKSSGITLSALHSFLNVSPLPIPPLFPIYFFYDACSNITFYLIHNHTALLDLNLALRNHSLKPFIFRRFHPPGNSTAC